MIQTIFIIALGIVLFGIGLLGVIYPIVTSMESVGTATGLLGVSAVIILAGGYIIGFEHNDLEINILKLVVALAGGLAYNYFDKNKQDGIRNSQMAANAAGPIQFGGYPNEARLREAARNDLGVPRVGGDGDGEGDGDGMAMPYDVDGDMPYDVDGDMPYDVNNVAMPYDVNNGAMPYNVNNVDMPYDVNNVDMPYNVNNLASAAAAPGANKPSEERWAWLKGYGTTFSLTVAAVAFAATYIVHILRQRRVCKELVESKTPEGKTVEKEVNRPINWTSPILMAICVTVLTLVSLMLWSKFAKINTKDLTSLEGLGELIWPSVSAVSYDWAWLKELFMKYVKYVFIILSLIIKFFSSLAHPNIEKFKNFKGNTLASVLELLLGNIADNPNIGETPVVAVGSFISAGLGYAFTNLLISRKC